MAAVQTWSAGLVVAVGQVVAPLLPNGFVYQSTIAGTTGTAEPNWPLIAGNTVVDGTVTWTAVTATAITWEAIAIYKSGGSEPVWPTTVGATVVDGTITWRCRAPNVTDSRCPNTKQVVIAASKVFAAYRDVVRYSATNNPADWSTSDDAGFLPTGLQAQVDPIVQVLGIYRGNLAVWSAGEFQAWQVDPDPARMALLDSIPSIGSTYYDAQASVAGDLYFLTRLGVRSVSIAGGSTNLQAGDVGTPVDSLIQQSISTGVQPKALFYPAGGQYWLSFGQTVWVYSQSRIGGIGAWSRYTFDVPIEYDTQQGGQLYVRSGETIYLVDEETGSDDGQPVAATIQWPWLDMGQMGVQKMMIGFDVVGNGAPDVSVGYDETDNTAFTAPFTVVPDTQPGKIIPLPVNAPSFALRVQYAAGAERWELQSATLYIQDQRMTA